MSRTDRKLTPENYDLARERWAVVSHVVADHEGVLMAHVRFAGGGETRAGAALIRARKLSCYLAQTAADLSSHALSNVSRLSRKTIREHVRAIEDVRDDDPAFSAELDALTAEIQLVLARKAFASRRREQVATPHGERPAMTDAPPARRLDPELDALLASWAAADLAKETWRSLCARDGEGAA